MLQALPFIMLLMTGAAHANQTPITGNVESKCTIYTDRQGVYGNPTADVLSTAPVDGGVHPVIRIDVVTGDTYTAKISFPNGFSSSPSLSDSLDWTGNVTVSQVSDALMSDYDANKVTYNNIHEYNLHTAGSTWFTIESSVEYGVNRSLPGGKYTALVDAECVAK